MKKSYPKLMKWTTERVVKFWNYESNFPENYFTFKFGRNILRHCDKYINHDGSILDYGCGLGFMIEHVLNNYSLKVYGSDLSKDSVKKVNDKYSNDEMFVSAYAPNDLIRSGIKFETILMLETIEHLEADLLIC